MALRTNKAGPSKSPLSRNSHGRLENDVFLSFRGEDTRHNFAGLLRDMLYLQGIRAFFDEEDLHKGERIEEILEAISRSKILVPIFSQRYAESKWCLREVAKMVECHRDRQERPIIPIFFDVDPNDVRYQSGPLEAAFQKHQLKGRGEVDGWKEALRLVGGISGFHLKNGNQRELINSITAELQKVLPIERVLDEGEYVVGHEHRLEEMMKRLDLEAKDVRIIGIQGIGGIGKTTLAKAVYNRIHRFFEASSFIENVREESKSKGLVQVQQRLIEDISKGKRKKKIYNSSQGTQTIIQMVGMMSVLLVLDDVDEQEQLDALARSTNWFHSGSRIIITTRQEEILKFAGLQDDAVYMVEELDGEESLQLFKYHAFGDQVPQEEYIKLSKEVISISSSLPLILRVFGSLFKTAKTPKEWNKLLKDLRFRQHSKVHEKLRICYDSLNDNEKLIFLDIACLLVGKNTEDAIYMWEDSKYLSPNQAIRSLRNRSLVKINNGNFEMHDQIRDMGREIVLRESLLHPGNRSRLWCERDVLDVSRNSQRSMTEGIILSLREGSDTKLSTEAFELISELRILLINFAIFGDCDFKHLPASLKWLEWKGCPLETLPLESKFKSIVVLNLSWSFISQLWTETKTPTRLSSKSTEELFEGLKVLDLSCCDCLNISPNFTTAPNLKKLILDECSNLKVIDDSIGSLKSLVFFSMRECVSLEKLPNKIYELSSLVVFNLEGCHRLVAFPQFLEGSKSLIELDPVGTAITSSSSTYSMENNQCTSSEIANFINGLSNLEELILRDCQSLEFLPHLHKFQSLKSLHIDGCQGLNPIRNYLFEDVAFREWDALSVSGSESTSWKQEFSFMLPIGCINDPLLIQQLQCHGYGDPCENGTMILCVRHEDIATGWVGLETILEAHCDYEDNVYGCCYTICFGRNDKINEAPRGKTIIMKVTTASNSKVTKVDVKLQKRSKFNGENMMKPYISISRRESFISPLTSVDPSSSRKFELELSMFINLCEDDKLEVIEYSTRLDDCIANMTRQLDIECREQQMLLFGWTVEELIILNLIFGDIQVSWYEQWHGTVLRQVASDKVLHHKIKVLNLSHCKFLIKTPDFIGTPHLKKLILDHCECLVEIDESIGQLKNLILLSTVGCAKLPALPCSILQLSSLQVINLEKCSEIKILPEASMRDVSLESLHELILDDCTSLTRIPDYVGQFRSLRRLSLRGCSSLERLPCSVERLVVLEELNLADCTRLVSIHGLQKLKSLQVLDMNGSVHLGHKLIHRLLKEATFHDLQAFSISIVNWDVVSPGNPFIPNFDVVNAVFFPSLIGQRKCSTIFVPFPRGGGRTSREPLYVEKINVVVGGGILQNERIILEIKTTEGNVLYVDAVIDLDRHVAALSGEQCALHVEPDIDHPQINAFPVESDIDPHFHAVDDLSAASHYQPEKIYGSAPPLVRAKARIAFHCSYTASFGKDDEINERLREEAASRSDDATRVGMLHVSCTEPKFWFERGDIWFRQSDTPESKGCQQPEDDDLPTPASKKLKTEGSYFAHPGDC